MFDPVIKQALQGRRLVPVVGAGACFGAGLPGWVKLIRPLGEVAEKPLPEQDKDVAVSHLLDSAQAYHTKFGRPELVRRLRNSLDTTRRQPTAIHRALTRLGVPYILTTNYDDLTERALREQQVFCQLVLEEKDLPYIEEAKGPTLIKLCGGLERPHTIAITRDDFHDFSTDRKWLIDWLSSTFRAKSALFLGYRVEDPFLQQVWREISRSLESHRPRSYTVEFSPDSYRVEDLKNRGIDAVALTITAGADKTGVLAGWLEKLSTQDPASAPSEPVDEGQLHAVVKQAVTEEGTPRTATSSTNDPGDGPDETEGALVTPPPDLVTRADVTEIRQRLEAIDRGVRALGQSIREEKAPGTHPGIGSLTTVDAGAATPLEKLNQERFERAREMLDKGSVVNAEREFASLTEYIRADGDRPEILALLARTRSNHGICFYYLERKDDAVAAFEEAYALAPEKLRIRFTWALGLSLKGELDQAAELIDAILAEAPNDGDAVALMAEISGRRSGLTAAIEFLEAHPVESAAYFTTLANHYIQAERFPDAAIAARRALTLEPDRWDAQNRLAFALAAPVIERKTGTKRPTYALTAAERADLDEAIRLIEESSGRLRAAEMRPQLADALLNLSGFRGAAGDPRGALAAATEAVGIRGEEAPGQLLMNLFVFQMALGHYPEAIQTARRLRQHEDPVTSIQREMDGLLAQAQFGAAAQLFDDELGAHPALAQDPYSLILKARALYQLSRVDEALGLLSQAHADYPNDPLVLVESAIIKAELRRGAEAEADFRAAEQTPAKDFTVLVRQQFGLFLLDRGSWLEAAPRLLGKMREEGEEPPIAEVLLCPFLPQYLICLYNLQRYARCLELARAYIGYSPTTGDTRGSEKVKTPGTFQVPIWELAINCLLHFRDFGPAAVLLEEVVSRTGRLEHFLRLVEVTFHLGEDARARQVLERAHAAHPDSVEALLWLARLDAKAGQPGPAIGRAARAVELAPDNVQARQTLTQIAVLSRETPDALQLAPDVIRLIQESVHWLVEREAGWKAIPVTDDLRALRRELKKHAQRVARVEKEFRKRCLPLALFARAVGRSLFETWNDLRLSGRLRLHMAQGSQEEQRHEQELVSATRAVSLDTTALFTLALLDRLHLLPRLFDQIHVATPVFDTVRQEADLMATVKPSRAIVGWRDGQLFHHEIPETVTAEQKRLLDAIMAFLKGQGTNVNLCGVEGHLWEDSKVQELSEQLGEAAYYPVAVAKGKGVALYSDDLASRSLGKQLHEVPSFCTQALLRLAETRGLISANEHQDALLALIKNHYWFVSEDHRTVIRALEVEGYTGEGELTRRLLARVSDSEIDPEASARILGIVLGHLWCHATRLPTAARLTQRTRFHWVELCAKNLAQGGEDQLRFIRVAGHFVAALAASMLEEPAGFFGVCDGLLASSDLSRERRVIIERTVDLLCSAVVKQGLQHGRIQRKVAAQWRRQLRLNRLLRGGRGFGI